MATLNDIVGAVLQGLTDGRVSADIHSADLVAHYLEHPVLRHFAVPSFDIQNVDVQLKFAIKSVEGGVIDAFVTHDELHTLDEKSVSTLTFKAIIKNKNWINSLDPEGNTTPQLIAD